MSDPDHIDVSHLSKAECLRRLYNRARVQGLGFLHMKREDMTLEQAQTVIAEHVAECAETGRPPSTSLYVDYLQGRVLKVHINGKILLTPLYDRDNGQGAAARAIAGD